MRLESLLPAKRPGGHRRVHPLREVIDDMRYELGVGLPGEPCLMPPWHTVYLSFRVWRLDGTWERLNDASRDLVRVRVERPAPSGAGCLDGQSTKATGKGAPEPR